MTAWLSIALDSILLILLASTLILGFRLAKRLRVVQQSQEELVNLTKQFNQAIHTADNAIRTLKLAAQEHSGELDTQIRKAQALSDELQFIVNAGDKLATRLTTQLTPNQTQVEHAAALAKAKQASLGPTPTLVANTPHPVATPAANNSPPRSRAENELLNDLEKITQARQLHERRS